MDEAGAIFDLPLKKPWYIAEFQGIGYTERASCGEKVLTKQNGTSFCVVSSPLCLIVDHRENSLYRENSLDIFPVS